MVNAISVNYFFIYKESAFFCKNKKSLIYNKLSMKKQSKENLDQ